MVALGLGPQGQRILVLVHVVKRVTSGALRKKGRADAIIVLKGIKNVYQEDLAEGQNLHLLKFALNITSHLVIKNAEEDERAKKLKKPQCLLLLVDLRELLYLLPFLALDWILLPFLLHHMSKLQAPGIARLRQDLFLRINFLKYK